MEREYILEMRDIVKEFNGVRVLDQVSLFLREGTVNALMGENGAGKSTLMKILNGIYSKTSGSIYLGGEEVDIKNSKVSKDLGIAMIHQELSTFPDLTVSANMYMGREFKSNGIINEKQMDEHCRQIFDKIGIPINPHKKLRDLSVAETQVVEIAKAVSMNARIIIMDEPTSAITDSEVEKLFAIISDLKKEGKAIIYISHKLDEIFQIADEITVLRDGKYIGSGSISEFDNTKLINMMVGRQLDQQFYKTEHALGETMLEVRNLSREGKFRNVSFSVRKGEIFGIAGLMGAGRTEVVETIFGLARKSAGEILIEGEKVEINKARDAMEQGIAFVLEDRKLFGLNLIGSIKENITLANLEEYCDVGFLINEKKENSLVDDYIRKLSIKTENRDKLTLNLSGGNQQKVVISRWLSCKPKILILDEPTRGIDVGAKAEIYRLMDDFVAQGNCIVMVSSEMPEVLGMSDRIMIMHEGRITGIVDRSEATQESIMTAASGL